MSSKDGEIRLLLKEIKEGGFILLEKNVAIEWMNGYGYEFGCAGKQKYEQLVEIKLSLEMEIQTYRSILEDEEKRIRRSYLLFCLFLTSLGAVDIKIKTVRAMAFGIQDMKVQGVPKTHFQNHHPAS